MYSALYGQSSDQSSFPLQTPRKTLRQSPHRFLISPSNIRRRSPRIQEKSQQTLLKSPVPKQTVAKNLGCLFSPPEQKSKPSPPPIEKKGGSLAQSIRSKENFSPPCRARRQQHPPGKQDTGEGLISEVLGSPADSSCSASGFIATNPFLQNPRGKSVSQLHSLKQSLRSALKPASSVRRQAPEAERPRDLTSLTQLKSDPVPSDQTPRKFGGGFSDQSLSPKVAETLSPRASLSNFTPLPCTRLRMGSVFSPCRTLEWVSKTCTPKKPPLRPLSRSGITPAESVQSPSYVSEEPLHAHRSKGEPSQWDANTRLSSETDLFCNPGTMESVSLMPRYKQASEAVAPSKRGSESSPEHLPGDGLCILDALDACEGVDPSASVNVGSHKSLSYCSPGQRGPTALQDKVLPAAKLSDLQQPFFQTPPKCTMKSSAQKFGSCTYTLRCTPDRRQREAAARLGNLETMSDLVTPQSTHRPLPSATSPPTYEVQLEMQASGLPKLRIKRVGSGVPTELQSQAEARKSEGEENKFDTGGGLCVSWCSRHSGKLEPVCISQSCFRSTHSTPGKVGGGQTYICQSYTPSRCISGSTSPSDGSASISWTPSPKQKVKVTPEAIKDWPRRKKAAVGCSRSERQAEPSVEIPATDNWGVRTTELLGGSKALGVEDFELEGVCRLQDQSPCSDAEGHGEKCAHKGASGLKSRKRVFEDLSPEEEAIWEAKRACPGQEVPAVAVHSTGLFDRGQETASSMRANPEKEAFSFSGDSGQCFELQSWAVTATELPWE